MLLRNNKMSFIFGFILLKIAIIIIIIIIKFLFILGQVKKRNTCVKTSREYAHSYTHSHTIKQKTKEIKMSSNNVGLKRIMKVCWQ